MANQQYRFEEPAGSGFMMGVLAGAVIGVGVGLLFAPKAGYKLRRQIADGAETIADRAQDGYRKVSKTAGEWTERGKEMADMARAAASIG